MHSLSHAWHRAWKNSALWKVLGFLPSHPHMMTVTSRNSTVRLSSEIVITLIVVLPWHREALRWTFTLSVGKNHRLHSYPTQCISESGWSVQPGLCWSIGTGNIVSEISIDKIKPSNCIWIPHHPVIKTDPLTTTKVWPVFNYSLNLSGKPSLNEAAFPGVGILANYSIF